MSNIFEIATRKAYRFASAKGLLSVEQLWELPLVAGSRITRDVKCDLDTIGRSITAELKSITEDGFVEVKPDPRKADLEIQIEILKHIVGVKQAEAAAAKDKAEKAVKRTKLIEALARKQDSSIEAMSEADIRKALEELDN